MYWYDNIIIPQGVRLRVAIYDRRCPRAQAGSSFMYTFGYNYVIWSHTAQNGYAKVLMPNYSPYFVTNKIRTSLSPHHQNNFMDPHPSFTRTCESLITSSDIFINAQPVKKKYLVEPKVMNCG